MGPVVGECCTNFFYFAGKITNSNSINLLFNELGYVRDKTDYVTTLHFLNLATYFVTVCWVSERIYRHYQEKKANPIGPETPDPSVQ